MQSLRIAPSHGREEEAGPWNREDDVPAVPPGVVGRVELIVLGFLRRRPPCSEWWMVMKRPMGFHIRRSPEMGKEKKNGSRFSLAGVYK